MSRLNHPIPQPQVEVGLEIKTLQVDCFTVLKRRRKWHFSYSDCCFGMSVPIWIMILSVHSSDC